MKKIHYLSIVLILLVVAIVGGLALEERNRNMRTPITQPGFDNIPTLIHMTGVLDTIQNSAAEEEVYRVTIPRNRLGLTDRAVHAELHYRGSNTTGVARTITYRVYYGGSVAIVTAPDTWANSASFRFSMLDVWLINTGAVDAQYIFIRDEGNVYIGNAMAIAEDSNKNLDLVITIQFSAASNDLFFTRLVGLITQMAP